MLISLMVSRAQVVVPQPVESNISDTTQMVSETTDRLKDAAPNPARGFTNISYSLPSDARSARIVVKNLLGNVVYNENIAIDSRSLRLDTAGFSNGIYIYSLLINNQPVMSKRLVVSN
jgi:hypothetical protein